MRRFLVPIPPRNSERPNVQEQNTVEEPSSSKRVRTVTDVVDIENLPADPGLRIRISDYAPNDRDQVRRAYLQKGPFQPVQHKFPQTMFGNLYRRFNPAWFKEYPDWLEYSIEKDAAFCLYYYLFKPDNREQAGGDSFVIEGFRNWKKKGTLDSHVGSHSSSHNQARRKCEDLLKTNQHIETVMNRQSDQERSDYRIRLNASIDCVRFLQKQGLAFRGHNESEESNRQGNFLELLRFLADHNKDISRVVLQNAPENLKLTAPEIQKDISNAAAVETTMAIIKDLGDSLFSILVDESRDVSMKEQLALALRYVDHQGCVVERFLGIIHVTNTAAVTLKAAIESLLSQHGLSLSRVRGQGYDGASNMRGELNGLKSLILMENQSAYYVHCFAHQLQLTLVAVAKNHLQIGVFFNLVSNIFNVAGASCKRRDNLKEYRAIELIEALSHEDMSTGQGKNQELSLKRPGDTRWGSHYGSLVNLILMFSSVIKVLKTVMEDGSNSEQRAEASMLLDSMATFGFAISLHLMKTVLGISNELSQALQRKDQDIVNAMHLVNVSKQRLQAMRENGWDSLLTEVLSFCEKHEIDVPNMDDVFIPQGRSRRRAQELTNLHHYQVDLFNTVIDMQLQELNSRFTEVTTDLLLCMSCLNPVNSFRAFDKEKLIKLAKYYPNDFSSAQLIMLDNQLETYIIDVRSDSRLSDLKGIGQLAEKMIETRKNISFQLVFLLLTLALTLPVATATVERAFSSMGIVKSRLRNRMGDQWMNDNLVTYIENDISKNIDNETIVQRFQTMKTRRGQL